MTFIQCPTIDTLRYFSVHRTLLPDVYVHSPLILQDGNHKYNDGDSIRRSCSCVCVLMFDDECLPWYTGRKFSPSVRHRAVAWDHDTTDPSTGFSRSQGNHISFWYRAGSSVRYFSYADHIFIGQLSNHRVVDTIFFALPPYRGSILHYYALSCVCI